MFSRNKASDVNIAIIVILVHFEKTLGGVGHIEGMVVQGYWSGGGLGILLALGWWGSCGVRGLGADGSLGMVGI